MGGGGVCNVFRKIVEYLKCNNGELIFNQQYNKLLCQMITNHFFRLSKEQKNEFYILNEFDVVRNKAHFQMLDNSIENFDLSTEYF